MKLSRLWLVACAALLVTVSCQLLLDVEEPEGRARPKDAGSKDPCAHAEAPAEPLVDDDPDPAVQKSFWLATKLAIAPLGPDAGVKPGLDLDESCTCQPDLRDGAAPCVTPGASPAHCDDDGGVDDALGNLAMSYSAILPGLDIGHETNQQISIGHETMLFYIKGYNGLANDKDVGVSIVYASGLFDDEGCSGPRGSGVAFPDADAGRKPPTRAPSWDGCDRWTVSSRSALLGKFPNRVPPSTTPAYVRDHVLVVKGHSFGFPIFDDVASITHAIAALTLIPEGTSFRAEGISTGRIAFDEIARVFGTGVVASADGKGKRPLCETPEWALIGPMFCEARDTMSSPSAEHQGQTCDAMSVAVGLVALPAQVADFEWDRPRQGAECDSKFVCAK